MGELSIGILLIILCITIIISYFSVRGEPQNYKVVYFFIACGVFMYSGVGIAYESVENSYIFQYSIFLVSLLLSVRFVLHLTVKKNLRIIYKVQVKSTLNEFIDVAGESKFVLFLAIVYLSTNAIYLFVPTFRLIDFFRPHFANIVLNNVYATNAANQSNIILKLASTINIMSLPFFCVYLQNLIDRNHKKKAVFLAVLSIYLEFFQKNYLGRYKMIISFVFIFFIIAFVTKDGFKLEMKKLTILGVLLLASVPFLYSFMSIRSGGSVLHMSLGKTFKLLLESEVYYPKYYETCSNIFVENGSLGLKFLLYLLCLPIPSIIFPGKPTVNASFFLTFAVTGRWFGDANYASCLPSIVGEGILIWGKGGIWLHGIVLGILIGLVFKFLMRYKSLTILYVYYAVNLLALGRGGAESYMSGLINGTVCLIIWVVILKKYRNHEANKIITT